MKLISVSCGIPREVLWHGNPVSTGIYKYPVESLVALRRLNLEGDRQADLTVHGGEEKAVYCYPSEHYDYWRAQLPGRELPPGVFGENFTTDGLSESSICIGDTLAVGTTEVAVTQPRLPLAVVLEGDVGAGDEIRLIAREPNRVPVSDITRLYVAKNYSPDDIASLHRVLRVQALPKSWNQYFRERLERTQS